MDELALLQQEFGIRSVHFTDAVVNQPAGHLRAICQEMLRRRLEIGWTGFFREDTLSDEDLALYQKSGLLTLYFSGDGASDYTLKLLGKDLVREQILSRGEPGGGQRRSHRLPFPGQSPRGDPEFCRSDARPLGAVVLSACDSQ